MAIPIGDAHDINILVTWALRQPTRAGGRLPADGEATAAARRLTAKAYKALSAGLHPTQVTHLTSPAAVRAETLIGYDIGGKLYPPSDVTLIFRENPPPRQPERKCCTGNECECQGRNVT